MLTTIIFIISLYDLAPPPMLSLTLEEPDAAGPADIVHGDHTFAKGIAQAKERCLGCKDSQWSTGGRTPYRCIRTFYGFENPLVFSFAFRWF